MATLGEAYIAVHADTAPFRRELREQVQKAADDFEVKLGAAVSKGIEKGAQSASKAGDDAGDKFSRGMKDKLGDGGKPPWVNIAGAFAAALDDGISALPMEVKAAIVIGVLAAVPIVAAALSGAIGSAVLAGFIGFGVALATQFEAVQKRFDIFQSRARISLVKTAQPFQDALLHVFDLVEKRLDMWAPKLSAIFASVSKWLEPIVSALLDSLEYVFDAVHSNLGNLDQLGKSLTNVIYILGNMLADVFDTILAVGEDGGQAFEDLVYILAQMVVATAEAIAAFAEFYGWVRKIVQSTPDLLLVSNPLLLLFKMMANEVDAVTQETKAMAYTNIEYVQGVGYVITATKEEKAAIDELQGAITRANAAAWNAIDTNIAYERSLDEIEEAIKRNGKTLDVDTENGRQNLEAIGTAIKLAQKKAEERAESGKYTQKQLLDTYNQEIERIYKAAEAQGVSRDRLREVYGVLIDILTLPPPNTVWAENLANALGRAAQNSRNIKYPGAYGDFDPQGRPLAEGGIVRAPTNALIGEAGTEAVIPLTKPHRAAELMRQSGLDKMLSGGTNVDVSVYLGNEAFDQHVQKVVVQENRSMSRQLSYGVRG